MHNSENRCSRARIAYSPLMSELPLYSRIDRVQSRHSHECRLDTNYASGGLKQVLRQCDLLHLAWRFHIFDAIGDCEFRSCADMELQEAHRVPALAMPVQNMRTNRFLAQRIQLTGKYRVHSYQKSHPIQTQTRPYDPALVNNDRTNHARGRAVGAVYH